MDKKLQHISSSLILPYIKDNHPNWEKFLKGYFQYLDENYFGKIINLTNNNNSYEIYPELLDSYLENYFNKVIDPTKYDLTDDNKKFFVAFSKFINGLKGNRKSFEFLFNSLTNFRIPTEGTDINIDQIEVGYEENEDWWIPGIIRYYNEAFDYDGTEDYNSEFAKPFTYRFIVNQSYDVIIDLIKSVHPAGFFYEFLTRFNFTDEIDFLDIIDMNTTSYYYYNFSDKLYHYNNVITYDGSEDYGIYTEEVTNHYYDGQINYSGINVENLEF